MTEEELDKEPAHIHTEKLADETKIERMQRYLCYFMITFGTVGGLLSFVYTSTTIVDDFTADD